MDCLLRSLLLFTTLLQLIAKHTVHVVHLKVAGRKTDFGVVS